MEASAKIENGNLIITIPMGTPAPSASGKTILLASTHGAKPCGLEHNGKQVQLSLNAYVSR